MATSPFVTGGGALPARQTTSSPFVTGGGPTPGRAPAPAPAPASSPFVTGGGPTPGRTAPTLTRATPTPVATAPANPLLSEQQRLANNQAQLAARQAGRAQARANSGGNYFTVSDAPNNTVAAPLQELNRLSQNAVMGYDPAAFKSWQAANPNGVNLQDPRYAGVDPTLMSQWAARNQNLIGPGASTFAPNTSGFQAGGTGAMRSPAPAPAPLGSGMAGVVPTPTTPSTPALVGALRQDPQRFAGYGMGSTPVPNRGNNNTGLF